jgi:nitrilase
MNSTINVAVLQCNASADLAANLTTLSEQLALISDHTALIVLPEMVAYRRLSLKNPVVSEYIPGQVCQFFSAHAKRLNAWIIIGSLCESIPNTTKVHNTMVVIDPSGTVQYRYRKLNLFNCHIPGNRLVESDFFIPGERPVIATINGFKIGLSICFDIRFPELYQFYASQGVDAFICAASFTTITGQAHWKTLLRARAIETQCYMLAPNQFGVGGGNIPTYGHSLILDPWGEILGEATGNKATILYAKLSKNRIADIQNQLPIQRSRPLYKFNSDLDNMNT